MTNVALTGLARDLASRAADGRPVRIGVIGSGEMGTDLVTQGMMTVNRSAAIAVATPSRVNASLSGARSVFLGLAILLIGISEFGQHAAERHMPGKTFWSSAIPTSRS